MEAPYFIFKCISVGVNKVLLLLLLHTMLMVTVIIRIRMFIYLTHPTFFRDGQKEITENCEIANKFNTLFNTLFTHIGPDQSKNINYTGDKTYKTYIPNKVSLIFEKVSETNVMQIINNLPNKTSCGFDGISTRVMKSIKHVILKSLTLIINQIINTGVIPNKLKIAKITPIFKINI